MELHAEVPCSIKLAAPVAGRLGYHLNCPGSSGFFTHHRTQFSAVPESGYI